MAKLEDALPFTLANEGGYTNDPADYGHATNLGITIADLASWRGHRVTNEDVRKLTIADVTPIYKHDYWDMLNLDGIESQGVATAIFDMGVNFGVGGAKQLVTRALDKLQQKDINLCDPKTFLRVFELLVEARYEAIVASNQSQSVFFRGWMARAQRLLTLV